MQAGVQNSDVLIWTILIWKTREQVSSHCKSQQQLHEEEKKKTLFTQREGLRFKYDIIQPRQPVHSG